MDHCSSRKCEYFRGSKCPGAGGGSPMTLSVLVKPCYCGGYWSYRKCDLGLTSFSSETLLPDSAYHILFSAPSARMKSSWMNHVLSLRSSGWSPSKARDKFSEFTGPVVRREGERRIVNCVGKEWSYFPVPPLPVPVPQALPFSSYQGGCCSDGWDQQVWRSVRRWIFLPCFSNLVACHFFIMVVPLALSTDQKSLL